MHRYEFWDALCRISKEKFRSEGWALHVCLENLVVDVVRQQTLLSILTSQQTLTSILTSQQTLPSILTSGWMWCLPCPPPAFSF